MHQRFLLLPVLLCTCLSVQAADIRFNEMPPAEKRIMPVGPNEILSFSAPIDKAKDSIVYIATEQTKTQEYINKMNPLLEQFFGRRYHPDPHRTSLGSGVIVSRDGYIVTNSHVIENADTIMVKIPGSDKTYEGRLVGSDPQSDIAVIKIDAAGLAPIRMGRSADLEIGDVVFAIGNPFGVGLSVSQGIISAHHKNGIGINEYENFIQTDASINPGNSGGALIDSRGALIGINSAIITRSGGNNGIGFAIEVDMVKDIAQKLITNGSVTRGYLGVGITDLTKELRKLYKHEHGALVNNVEPDSPAAEAGLRRGDLIVGIEGRKIKNAADLKNTVAAYAPGTRIKVAFERDGGNDTATVTLAKRSENVRQQSEGNLFEGLSLENLDEKYRYRLRIPDSVEGVLVTEVESRSEAAEQGVRPGDVIVQVEQQPVTSLSELSKALKQAKRGLKRVYVYREGRVFIVALK